ncbi:MAG: segregation and condensation protein [Frankiaceae bacterium]|jgi:segregation and condensation protein B|nr:segregation and condensation protein [Frankiaceae bacterium]
MTVPTADHDSPAEDPSRPSGTPLEAIAERGAPHSDDETEVAAEQAPGTDAQADISALDLDLAGSIEAICMVVDDPVEPVLLAQVLGAPVEQVVSTLGQLAGAYEADGRGFELREVAGGWRFYSRPEYAPAVERFVLDGQQAKLTQAALETLAVVAYRQPISRSRVSAVRGVNVDGVIRTLLARGLVEEAGTEDGSGATLYRTSSYFLERLGMRDLSELPELAPLLPDVEFMDASDG